MYREMTIVEKDNNKNYMNFIEWKYVVLSVYVYIEGISLSAREERATNQNTLHI